MRENKDIKIACFYSLLAAMSYATMNAFAKYAKAEVGYGFIIFFRFFIGMIFLLPLIRSKKQLKISKPYLLLLRCFMAISIMFCLLYALSKIPVANVVVLSITYPLFLPIIAKFVFKRRISPWLYFSICIGFIGIIFVINPSYEHFIHSGSLLALFAGILMAISFIAIRFLVKGMDKTAIIFYYYLFGLVAGAIAMPFGKVGGNIYIWLTIFFMGLTGTLFQYALNAALQKAHSVIVSPIMFSSIFFGMLIDWLIWNQLPSWQMAIGSFLILIGIVATIIINSKNIKHLL